MTAQFVLVPGFWLGAWAWDEVAGILRERGFDVVALTLPGLQEGADTTGIDLGDHARAIRSALDGDASRRILAVHSGAAFAGALVIDRHPELVDHLALVDTGLPGNGTAFNAEAKGDFRLEDAWDSLAEEGSFQDLTEEQLATMRERARPVPHGVVTTPVRLANDARFDVPVTAICSEFRSDQFRQAAEQGVPWLADMPGYRNIRYVDLPTGHWPMWSRPQALADLLLAAGGATTD